MKTIAAIQIETRIGDAPHNIRLAEQMATEAVKRGAEIIALPEFFTSAIAPDDRAYSAVLASGNDAIKMLERIASKHGVWIGGSMLLEDRGEIYNRYVFAEPSGARHAHDKDLPTMWENAFYVGGEDDGCWETDLGGVGAAVCWELIRSQTVERLRGKVELVMTGTHWWTLPENWPALGPDRGLLAGLGARNEQLSQDAPAEFAKRVGAPVVQASHCGTFQGRYRVFAGSDIGFPYRTHFVGATQIVDAHGTVLATRSAAEGPGIVYQSVILETATSATELDEARFWIPELPSLIRNYWDHQNWVNRSVYARRGRALGLKHARQEVSK